MWPKVLEYFGRLLTLSQKVQQQDEDLKELRQEMKAVNQRIDQLAEALQRVAFELQRQSERADVERRMLLLEVQNLLLRHGRELPPPDRQPDGLHEEE